MLTAHYTGPARPGLTNRFGWWLIRTGQKAPYDFCTHTEAIHELHADGRVTIASSSLADKGVRTKRVRLTPGSWVVVDVPAWDVQASIEFFADAVAKRQGYDYVGAGATMLPGKQKAGRLFCTEAVLAPFVPASHYFTPAQGLAICLGHGRDVTEQFFAERA
jgi:hypothetical protein